MAKPKAATRRSWGKLRTMRNGRLQASYLHEGIYHYAPHTYDAKIDAEGWLANERKLIELGGWTSPKQRAARAAMDGMTVRQYADQWLDPDWRARRWDDDKRQLTAKSRHENQRYLDTRILPTLGDFPGLRDLHLREITPEVVREWWAALRSAKPTTARTNDLAYQLLKAMCNTAVEDGLLDVNPCQAKSKQSQTRDIEGLTTEELDIVAAEVPEHYRVATYIAAWCGVRSGELFELRRKDIRTTSDGGMVIRVERSATRVGNEIVVGPPKSEAGKRGVTVPPHVAAMLTEHMARRTGEGPEALVFTTTRRVRLSTTAFTKSVKKGYVKVGMPELRIHDLRHVGATMAAIEGGATTKELMARFGHNTPGMAMRYQIASKRRAKAIADNMSRAVTGKPMRSVELDADERAELERLREALSQLQSEQPQLPVGYGVAVDGRT